MYKRDVNSKRVSTFYPKINFLIFHYFLFCFKLFVVDIERKKETIQKKKKKDHPNTRLECHWPRIFVIHILVLIKVVRI